MPQFTATYHPGGYDDYSMPEMYAPAPQRVMPEVPHNMQQDLQRMELEAREIQTRPHNGHTPNYLGGAGNEHADNLTDALENFRPFEDASHRSYKPMASFEEPGFSPFPKVKGDNIPPSDKEKEEILYNAREHVLQSNNVNMQLSWARDALNYVETAAENRAREKASRYDARPQTPMVEHDLRVDAMSIVQYLVDQNHPEAVFMKAKWDEFGKFGTREDKREAFKGYRAAAEQGWGRAEYRMGMLFENANQFDQAIVHYQQGEALGDSAAMYRLGMMALLGQHGQRQDYQRGIDLINHAADTADEDAPQGAYVFGMLIARDLPDITVPEALLPYKVDTARQYIEKAAYLGFAKAQLKMGQAYELCQLGCDFNPAYSLHYYGLASVQGQPEAALGVSRWFLFGYDGNFAKNEALAYKYARQAADAKLATGEFAMGYYHEIGIHVPKDLSEARRWYELASSHGNTDAVGRLDSLKRNKSLSKNDHETTALSRIKSQHGSMRGKRPERLQRLKEQQHMAALPESGPSTPNDPTRRSPMMSPNQSPGRAPAFGLNVPVEQGNPMRPKSAAPYPDDDHRPQPLSVMRPKSAAPYPDDNPHQMAPHAHSGLPPPGRPDAFGIRPGSAGRGAPGPKLSPGIVPAGMPPAGGRGRGGPGLPPSPGYGRQGSMGGPVGGPGFDPRRPNPNAGRGGPLPPVQGGAYGGMGPSQQSPPMVPPAGSMPGAQPYGARPGSRASDVYGPPGGPAARHDSLGSQGGYGSPAPGPGPRHSSQPQPQQPVRPGTAGSQRFNDGGRASAPPPQAAPAAAPPAKPAKKPTEHPDGKTVGNGPATFDEMGVPRVKDKDDCVVM